MQHYQTHSDDVLSSLLKEGDEEAFVEIYRRNWRRMYDAAFKRLRDEAACEDLVQNVFTDLWERRSQTDIENIGAYLTTAVRFQVIKYSTRQQRASPLIDDFESMLISSLRTEDPVIESESLMLVRLWIEALPEKRREIFQMHYLEELSSAKIAELLGISQKTVQNQITTATNSIRDQVSKNLLLLAFTLLEFTR